MRTAKSLKKSNIAAPETADNSQRIVRRERRRESSREEIVHAARRVLLRTGVGAMTLAAVAKEVGVSKTALYYYYPSKDALLFEVIFGALETHARAVRAAVDGAKDGAEALRLLVSESVKNFAPRLDDFRLAFLYGQVANVGDVQFDAAQLTRIRPLNELWLAGTEKKIAQDRKKQRGRLQVEPRLLAFLAYLSAIGLLTMKGLVEHMNDPLLYSDDQLIDAFAKLFEAALAP